MAHLTGIGIENFRVFKDYTEFDFAPITILTGANNSGKSSLFKALLLLKESFEYNGVIEKLKFEKLNIGSYEMNVSKKANEEPTKPITISLPFPSKFNNDLKIHFSFIEKKETQTNGLCQVKVFCKENRILDIKKENIFIDLPTFKQWIDEIDPNVNRTMGFNTGIPKKVPIPSLQKYDKEKPLLRNIADNDSNNYEVEFLSKASDTRKDLGKLLREFLPDLNISGSTLYDFGKAFMELSHYIDLLRNFGQNYTHYSPAMDSEDGELISEDDYEVKTFPESMYEITENGIMFFNIIVEGLKDSLSQLSIPHFEYLTPYRANQQILHTTDSQKTAYSILLDRLYKDDKPKFVITINNLININELLKEFGDFGELYVENLGKNADRNLNIDAYIVYLKKGENKTLLSNLGFGVTQLITLLLQIAVSEEGTTIIIEEPETNLHPKLQLRLAELFLFCYKEFGVRFIIETHSEYLIRGLQEQIAEKPNQKDDAIIYYLRNPENLTKGKEPVEKITFNEKGEIDYWKFDSGFYDMHETELAFGLLNIQRKAFFGKLQDDFANEPNEDQRRQKIEERIQYFTDIQDLGKYRNDLITDLGTKFNDLNSKTQHYLCSARFFKAIIDRHKSQQAQTHGIDFAPVILQYGRAVENELRNKIFADSQFSGWDFQKCQNKLEKSGLLNSSDSIDTKIKQSLNSKLDRVSQFLNSLKDNNLPFPQNSPKILLPLNITNRTTWLGIIRTYRNSAGHENKADAQGIWNYDTAIKYSEYVEEFFKLWCSHLKQFRT